MNTIETRRNNNRKVLRVCHSLLQAITIPITEGMIDDATTSAYEFITFWDRLDCDYDKIKIKETLEREYLTNEH